MEMQLQDKEWTHKDVEGNGGEDCKTRIVMNEESSSKCQKND